MTDSPSQGHDSSQLNPSGTARRRLLKALGLGASATANDEEVVDEEQDSTDDDDPFLKRAKGAVVTGGKIPHDDPKQIRIKCTNVIFADKTVWQPK